MFLIWESELEALKMIDNTTTANALLILLLLLSPWSALQALPQNQDTLLQLTAKGHVLRASPRAFFRRW